MFYEWSTAEFTGTWRLLGVEASLKLGCCDLPLNTSSLRWPEIALMRWIAIPPTPWFLSSIPVLPCFIFGHETTYTLRVFAVCKLYYCIYWSDNLSERKNLHKSESPFSFLFGDIRLYSPQGIKISWITALDTFSNLCLVLLLLLARSLVQ